MRVGLVQLCSSDLPSVNLPVTASFVREAAARGAEFVLTPEVTNIVSTSRKHQVEHVHPEQSDPTLAHMRELAAELKIWIMIGSLALKSGDSDGRFANRSFLIDPLGGIAARYDKIHMFDVDISQSETYRESDGYRPGDQLSVTETPIGTIGQTICYDVRFPHLHRAIAKMGAQIISAPAAFSPVSGAAHWEVLQRARAIETGCFILAPAQCGQHAISVGQPRSTYGHSLIVSPWGDVIADAGVEPGVVLADLDLDDVVKARARIPALRHDRPIAGIK